MGAIKDECDMLYQEIEKAQNRLAELRIECKHPETYVGNYSWRIGTMSLAHICIECGEMLGYLTEDEILNHPNKQLNMFEDDKDSQN